MKNNLSISIFVLVEIIVVSFILLTAGALPEHIASHFNDAGEPNGFMSNRGYIMFMILFAVVVPSFVVLPMLLKFNIDTRNINIPHKAYWLSDQNKTCTIKMLKDHIICLGTLISLFIAYVHWLLIKVNSVQPVQLPNSEFSLGLGVFISSLLIWAISFVLKFTRVPKA